MHWLTDAFLAEIRAAILEGDIDKALELTKAHYGDVLEDSPQILFRLRCRKFIEIIRSYSEPETSQPNKRTRSAKDTTTTGGGSGDMFSHDMELDDQMQDAEAMDTTTSTSMEAEPPASKDLYHANEALEYGQQLKADYMNEDKRQYEKTLNDIFSLVAYSDPASSPHGHLLDLSGRVAVAEELNAAILGTYSPPDLLLSSCTLVSTQYCAIFTNEFPSTSVPRQILRRRFGTPLPANGSARQRNQRRRWRRVADQCEK